MTTTLLLDLDETLLSNNFNEFLPKYLEAFSGVASEIMEPSKFVNDLMQATQVMLKNERPDCTLKEVFETSFLPMIDQDEKLYRPMVDRFYETTFPKLKKLTSPIPEAEQLIKTAQERGYKIAITTNPFFPREAILERLEWANLSIDKYRYDLVASYETFHFVKPNPAFFAEVLGQLGWPSGPMLVVGDDMERDIIAGRKLGLPGYWITKNQKNGNKDDYRPIAAGSMRELLHWLETTSMEDLIPDYTTPSALLAILQSTPAVFDTLTRNLPSSVWSFQPKQDEWGLKEIIWHLRDVETEVNLVRIHKIFEKKYPFISGANTDHWAVEREYSLQNGPQALGEFTIARMKLLEILKNAQEQDWQRMAKHAIFGPTTLLELVTFITQHDMAHIQQAHEVVNKLDRI